jgi:hypothetical protein
MENHAVEELANVVFEFGAQIWPSTTEYDTFDDHGDWQHHVKNMARNFERPKPAHEDKESRSICWDMEAGYFVT